MQLSQVETHSLQDTKRPEAEQDCESIVSLIGDKVHLHQPTYALLKSYQNAKPFPHLVLDDVFSNRLLDRLTGELSTLDEDKLVHHKREWLVKSNLRSATDLGLAGYEFASFVHSAGFLYLLSELTGIWGLLPDPYLGGAGFHRVPPGGKFEIHADRNADLHAGLLRRIVVITYLNRDWDPSFGGQLELWNSDGSRCERVIEPVFNRVVVKEIGDTNFHAVRPVLTENRYRMSFAAYFHTVGEKGFEEHHSIYAPGVYQRRDPFHRRLIRGLVPPLLLRALRYKE